MQFQLWFWSCHRDAPARRISVPALQGFEHAEGISPAVIDGRQCIMIVSDDGSREQGRCALSAAGPRSVADCVGILIPSN